MKNLLAMGVLFLTLLIGVCVGTRTAEVSAAEGNDSYDTATVMKENKTITSRLNTDKDIDWYLFEVPDSVGVEWVEFKSSAIEGDGRFDISIFVGEDGMPATQIRNSGYLFAPERITFTELSYAKGTQLYIKVQRRLSSPVGVDYDITFCTSAEPVKECDWAIENDDNFAGANVLTGSKQLCGILNTGDDVDWYKYEVKNSAPFNFTFKSCVVEGDGRFDITIFESADGMPAKQIDNSGYLLAPEKYISPDYAYSKGSILYIKINRRLNNGEGIRYILSAKDTTNDLAIGSLNKPYSILAGTNVVVGKAEAGATVYVKYGKKTYNAVADADGIYRVTTAKLSKGKSVKIWQKVGKTTSKKITIKVVKKY